MIVIHQLPKTQSTLWVRLLGKGKVRERFIQEVAALSEDRLFDRLVGSKWVKVTIEDRSII